MYMTAPMGVMQTVQTPLPVTPQAAPQANTPAAQTQLANAVSGTGAAPSANPDRKPFPTLPTRAGIVSPETLLLQEAEQAPASGSTAALTATMLAAAQQPARRLQTLVLPNNAGFAAQLLAQEDAAGIAMPAAPNIADLMKRVADRKPQPQGLPTPTARSDDSDIRFATPPQNALNAVMRRDVQGSVTSRGAQAYLQAQQRIVRVETRSTAAIEESLENA